MARRFRNIGLVAGSTIASRILGLIRDVLIYGVLGTSVYNSAFILAFTLPNLFRRLLGEGALTSALIPVLSGTWETDRDAPGGFRLVNQVLTRLGAVLLALTLAGMTSLFIAGLVLPEDSRWHLGARYGVLLFPYVGLVCVAALFAAALNARNRFAIPALNPVFLNLTMITGLLLGGLVAGGLLDQRVIWLSLAVLAGGLIQVGASAWALWRDGWRPAVAPETSAATREIWLLFLPGLAGAAILQVNILVSRLFAFGLDDAAVSILYLASRLMELPLGVFTVAIVTVTFPRLARQGSAARYGAFQAGYAEALRLIMAVMVPAGVGLTLLARPILEVLFVWGAFEPSDAGVTVPVLAIYALALPAYSVATLATRGFHALKDMQTPVRTALVSLGLNAVLCLALIVPLGILGLALANVIAAAVQALLLHRSLLARLADIGGVGRGLGIRADLGRIGLAVLAMGSLCLLCLAGVPRILPGAWEAKAVSLVLVGLTLPLAVFVYFGVLGLLRFTGTRELLAVLLRRRQPAGSEDLDDES